MSGEQRRPIVCGKCHVGVDRRVEADGRTVLFCPSCGEADDEATVIREVMKYVADKTIGNAMGGLRRDIPGIEVTLTDPSKKSYRFIVE